MRPRRGRGSSAGGLGAVSSVVRPWRRGARPLPARAHSLGSSTGGHGAVQARSPAASLFCGAAALRERVATARRGQGRRPSSSVCGLWRGQRRRGPASIVLLARPWRPTVWPWHGQRARPSPVQLGEVAWPPAGWPNSPPAMGEVLGRGRPTLAR
jgi:hypothetical protein